MVLINEEEKQVISKRLPNVHICRTVRQKSKRHRYYMEEARSAMKLLYKLRDPEQRGNVLDGRP